jgi:hypothetical protein
MVTRNKNNRHLLFILFLFLLPLISFSCFLNNPFLLDTYRGGPYTTTTITVFAPGVAITSSQSGITYDSPFSVTVSFSGPVTGFSQDKIVITNGSITGFTETTSNTVWNVEITPSGTGTVTISIPAGQVKDIGTGSVDNTASNIFNIMYDGTGPGVSISSTDSGTTSNSPFTINVAFDEVVTGFTIGDVIVSGGSAGNLQSVTVDREWTVDITPSSDGIVTVDIPFGAVKDQLSGLLDNTPAIQFVIEYDGTDPGVVISSNASDPTAVSPIPFTITFNEDVLGFTPSDITVTNGTIDTFSENQANRVWAVSVSPDPEPVMVSMDIASAVCQDTAGNFNTAATQISRTYNTGTLTVNITSSETTPTNTSPFSITMTFSQDVQDFDVGDITVGGGSASSLTGGPSIWNADITPSADGAITVDINASVASDLTTGFIFNEASSQYSIIYDGSDPTFTAVNDTGSGQYKAGDTITFDLDMGETGLSVFADLTTLDSEFSSNQLLVDDNDNTYSYTTPVLDAGGNMNEGSIPVQFTAYDDAGNSASDSSLTINLDKTGPLFVSAVVEEAAPTDLVVIFNEPVTLTDQSGFELFVQGSPFSITGVSGSGTDTLTFSLTGEPGSHETVTLSYNSGTGDARDSLGNDVLGFSNQQVTVNTIFNHGIVIDGINDFTAFETFTTSSASTGYTGYVSWDDTYIYVGMEGPDINANDADRWLVVYMDGTPGTTTGITFNNQTPQLPFNARWFYQWRTDGLFTRMSSYNGTNWVDTGWGGADWDKNGTFFETRFPRANLGDPATVRFHMFMLNEVDGGEWTWGAVPIDSFPDGFDPDFTKYFEFDFSSTTKPRDYVSQ